jgi:hypothetical protein
MAIFGTSSIPDCAVLPFSCLWVTPAPVRPWVLWAVHGLARGADQGDPPPLEKARCTRLSREFIGDSSPAASVGGARRLLQIACTSTRVMAAGFLMASLELDAAAHAQDPSRLARCKRPPGETLPLGAAPLHVRSPQRWGFSFRPGSTGVGLRSTSSRSSGSSRRRMRCPKRCSIRSITPWSLVWMASCHANSSN